MAVINTSGRRKTAVARIYLKEGKGDVTVNNRPSNEYFQSPVQLQAIQKPFELTETKGKFDVKVNADGGGLTGQSEAIALAISKALVELNIENKVALKAAGLLTRDPRMVERKKPGQKKARKRFQFSKR
ncbi:MAG: 30S ribosomal protein S9 [Flavobacteriales bacterium]|jgi:small subunit ribosomal protein S9|nr:30S ribosomal protein S9 [Flavobacteriales bacterium]